MKTLWTLWDTCLSEFNTKTPVKNKLIYKILRNIPLLIFRLRVFCLSFARQFLPQGTPSL
jgi:hypothetical protein